MEGDSAPLPAGATIGILGTGQLGRMLAAAAGRMGLNTHVYGPDTDAPAAQFASAHTRGDYDDQGALTAFASQCDAITFEFENVPDASLKMLAGIAPLRPGPESLRVSQDRLIEKQFLESLDLPVAPFAPVGSAAEIIPALEGVGGSCILKTRRLGYDGKGQVRLNERPADPGSVWQELGAVPSIAEGIIPFVYETSAIITRGADGTVVAYDLPVNVHADGILSESKVGGTFDAILPQALIDEAQRSAIKIATALDHIGTLAVEYFVTADGTLIINEIAPRVHNTGHWTLDGCVHDQFANHMRAVAGHQPAPPLRHSDVRMTNLIGEDVLISAVTSPASDAVVHLYGKSEIRPGRKMGHINTVVPQLRTGSRLDAE